ncbi:hypothetical protein BDV29DRAFT_161839 [Aspergillus leporis]|jgi:hypothetical protein|uniref:Uncharacterized protein n=1 Tax=Aspergillus leporis TaxID=41062 RepID=A0A5N5WKG8_9EURO|nr:hypothetical protein BDV29DRAFT_161839 [Aspergillus leporis]
MEEIIARFPSSHFGVFQGYSQLAKLSLTQTDDVIRATFATTQKDAGRPSTFHDHPVALMTANFLKKSSGWSYERVVFPNLDRNLSPNGSSIGRINHSVWQNGCLGLLANSFANAGFNYFQQDKYEGNIRVFNSEFDNHSTDLYAEYFRHVCGLAPSAKYVTQYQSILLSHAFKTLKRAQLATGGWTDPSMEMYTHFVKLLACGASDAEIQSIYNSFTTGEDAVDASAFPLIVPDKWKSYRAWLNKDQFGISDIKAQNLHQWYTRQASVMLPPVDLAYIFAQKFDYWKAATLSCFTAETHVLLADGTIAPINRIQKGDQVRSRIFCEGQQCEAESTVAFVSKPKRAGRNLYSYRTAPLVKFTENHPLVESSSGNGHFGGLILKFVNPDLARSTNPSWRSVPTIRIPEKLLEKHDGAVSDSNEILYDLVFEPETVVDLSKAHVDDGPTTYTVVDPSTGQTFDVASEAPVFQWFPCTMIFFEHMLRAMLEESHDTVSITSWLAHPDTILHESFWAEIGQAAWDKLSQHASTSDFPDGDIPFSFSVDGLLHADESLDPQTVADGFESLHSRLGRRITHEILTGWAHLPVVDESSTIPILLLNSFHTIGHHHTVPELKPRERDRQFHVSAFQGDQVIAARKITATRQGSHTFDLHSALDLSTGSTDECSSKGRHAQWAAGLEICDPFTGMIYRGRSLMHENAHAVVGLGQTTGGEYATIDVKVMRVSPQALRKQEHWDGARAMAFAAMLGQCFAANLVAQHFQSQHSILKNPL